jgi:hypothetical protein
VCPTCEAGAPWARVIIDAYQWLKMGGRIEDVAPEPTCAVVDGVLTLMREVQAAEAWEADAVRQDAAARR